MSRASLSDMRAQVGRLVQDEGEDRWPSIDDALNRAQESAASTMLWPQLVTTDETGLRNYGETLQTFVAGDAYCPMPFHTGRLRAALYQSATYGGLEIVDDTELYKRAGSSLTTVGTPCLMALVGETIQYRAITEGAVTVTVSCNLAGNDNSKALKIYYEKGAGLPGQKNWQTLEGTFSSGVAINSTVKDPYGLKMISVPAGWVGGISLTTAGAVRVGTIQQIEEPPTNSNSTTQIICRPLYRLWPVPDTSYPLTLSWWRTVLPLTETDDVPEIPVSPFMVMAATAEIFQQMNNAAMAQLYGQRAAGILNSLRALNKDFRRVSATPYGGSFTGQTGMHTWRAGP